MSTGWYTRSTTICGGAEHLDGDGQAVAAHPDRRRVDQSRRLLDVVEAADRAPGAAERGRCLGLLCRSVDDDDLGPGASERRDHAPRRAAGTEHDEAFPRNAYAVGGQGPQQAVAVGVVTDERAFAVHDAVDRAQGVGFGSELVDELHTPRPCGAS